MRRVLLFALIAASSTALLACGGDDKQGGDGGGKAAGKAENQAVATDVWVKDVCTGLTTWITSVSDTSKLESIVAKATAAEGLRGARDELGKYFDGVVAQTGTLVTRLERAGYPDVDDGQKAASTITSLLTTVRDAFRKAGERVAGVAATDPVAFQAGIGEAMSAMTAELASAGKGLGATLSGANFPELESAGKKEPACKKLTQ